MGLSTRVGSVFATVGIATATVVCMAVPASAAMQPGCALYPESIYRSGGQTYFASTATCGTNPVVSFSQAALQRSGTQIALASAKTSSGATSLRSASSSALCVAGYSYRSYGWGQDINTGASEGAGAYKTVTC